MLKEERELRKWSGSIPDKHTPEFFADVTALVRAVQEDCAEEVDVLADKWRFSKSSCFATEIAAAIRGKK